ncbi:MAG TPA: hypothetical protein VNX25_08935 [Verrucomicrobiae bacterium]|nr:hypothetical protein [Verrucomicrobiae bacterium]
MKMEVLEIAGEMTPALVIPCLECGERLVVSLPEVRTTSPVECGSCRFQRTFSYQEYVDIVHRYSLVLLEHSISRMRRTGN